MRYIPPSPAGWSAGGGGGGGAAVSAAAGGGELGQDKSINK